jgi:hypothetical protein
VSSSLGDGWTAWGFACVELGSSIGVTTSLAACQSDMVASRMIRKSFRLLELHIDQGYGATHVQTGIDE